MILLLSSCSHEHLVHPTNNAMVVKSITNAPTEHYDNLVVVETQLIIANNFTPNIKDTLLLHFGSTKGTYSVDDTVITLGIKLEE